MQIEGKMEKYKNLSENSGVESYEVGPGYIKVKFIDGHAYLYTDESAGQENVEEMKTLAAAGKGLSSFISRSVRDNYAAKYDRNGQLANRSRPPGTIVPVLAYPEIAAAARWLCETFGFQERLRIGSHRSQLVYGGEAIILVTLPEAQEGQIQFTDAVQIFIPDLDAHYEQARQSGAEIISPPADYPYGERQYSAQDLVGRRWTFSQSIANVDPAEWGGELLETGAGTEQDE
jgi:uncharacterized glyoxalase superfamily protein PhnB